MLQQLLILCAVCTPLIMDVFHQLYALRHCFLCNLLYYPATVDNKELVEDSYD